MKLSVFVSALGWASVFAETWLWLMGSITMDGLRIGLYILFWVLALLGGILAWEPGKRMPRR